MRKRVIMLQRMRVRVTILMPMCVRVRFAIMSMSMCVLMSCLGYFAFRSQHFDLRGVDPAAVHATKIESCAQIQRGHRILKDRERHASIHQGAKKHVAANAGETIQIGDLYSR